MPRIPSYVPFARAGRHLVLVPLLALTGCFTASVWTGHPLPLVGAGLPRTGSQVGTRLAATPFALALDFLTWPVQLCLLGSGYQAEADSEPPLTEEQERMRRHRQLLRDDARRVAVAGKR